jgi:hypothetical protein
MYDQHVELQDSIQHAYLEGLSRVKKKINSRAENGGFEEVLREGDIMALAEDEDAKRKEFIASLKQLYVYETEKPQEKMIDDRINHYYELQRYNEERALIKEIKRARKLGDDKLATKLQKDWESTYGRSAAH